MNQEKERKEAFVAKQVERRDNKLLLVVNMLDRHTARVRFNKWKDFKKYCQEKESGFDLAEKIIYKRKLRNNFN